MNYASAGSPTTSAAVRPDGTLLAYEPYGEEGLLVTDIDLAAATGLLASRYKPVQAGPHVTARRDPERDPSLMDPSP